MKVLLTGATGFIGSHLTRRLAAGEHQLWALYRSRQKFEQLGLPAAGVQGRLSTDAEQPNDWIERLPDDLDAVVHLAGLAFTFRDDDFAKVNVTGTQRLVEDLKRRHPRLRFLFVSSLAAAGPSVEGRVEAEPEAPVSSYGQSKLDAERVLFREAPPQWKPVAVRPPIVIGPGDQGMLDMFRMVKRRACLMPGIGSARKPMSFVGVGDLAGVMEKCLLQPLPDRRPLAYFVAHPQPVAFAQLMEGIKQAIGVRRALKFGVPIAALRLSASFGKLFWALGLPAAKLTPDKVREAGAPGWHCSPQRSIAELGAEYREDLDKILAETAEDYHRRGWL